MDSTSFVWGVTIGVIGMFFTGFLKKAGEDCYSWVKKKLKPLSLESQAPQMVILKADGASVTVESSTSEVSEPATIKRASSLSFDDIAKSIDSAPPMQRDRVAESYIGLRVEWDTYFKSGSLVGGNLMRLRLTTDPTYRLNTVCCEVPADKYREFGILPENTKVRVLGELAKVGRFDIELKNVHLHIYS